MKERPILFSGPMVRAILEGRKTMTRRVVQGTALEWLQPGMFLPEFVALPENHLCPYGFSGDNLWVRETHWVNCAGNEDGSGKDIIYRADDPNWPYGWRPSIFMPRWASRIALEITNVRVERLQEITDEDVLHEGFRMDNTAIITLGYRGAFQTLWDSINGKKYPWSSNPWVWVIEFRRR